MRTTGTACGVRHVIFNVENVKVHEIHLLMFGCIVCMFCCECFFKYSHTRFNLLLKTPGRIYESLRVCVGLEESHGLPPLLLVLICHRDNPYCFKLL